jgi:RNA polymerase sigma-70 factor (ECF subfamily)
MTQARPTAPPDYDAARLLPALERYFRRRVAAHEVDDLVQDVFVQLQSRRSTEVVQDVERYVFVVAGNVLMQRYRKEKRWFGGIRLMREHHEEDAGPERALLAKDGLASVMQILNRLPARTRQIFILHRFEEMTYPRIAATLGISKSAVEKHMIRALRALNDEEADQ